jgi:2-polyprenyl-3-methyl-5-hydroxy-6-metoxy-1,4-benzoquinol methylase
MEVPGNNGYCDDPDGYENTKAASRHARDREPRFLAHLSPTRTLKGPILDFGCGTGKELVAYFLPLALKAGVPIVGVDLSPSMIQYAQTHSAHAQVTYVAGDILDPALSLQLGPTPFDLILSRFVFHLVPDWK